jgi:hypothetical protein
MCYHLNLKILIHMFTIIYLIMIIIIMRGKNFVAHLDGPGGTPVCRGYRLLITDIGYSGLFSNTTEVTDATRHFRESIDNR